MFLPLVAVCARRSNTKWVAVGVRIEIHSLVLRLPAVKTLMSTGFGTVLHTSANRGGARTAAIHPLLPFMGGIKPRHAISLSGSKVV